VKNSLTDLLINSEKKNINLLLVEWKKKTTILSLRTIDLNASLEFRQQAEALKAFIENLSQIVNNWTTENSGLTQFQIDTYLSKLPSVEAIYEVLTALDVAIETAQNPTPPPTSTSTSTSSASTTSSSNQAESSDFQYGSAAGASLLTPEEVNTQQAVVATAQGQVNTIQNQITQIEQQQSPTAPEDTGTTVTPIQDINDSNNINTSPAPFILRIINNSQGIIIQPGPPRLIQGTDPF